MINGEGSVCTQCQQHVDLKVEPHLDKSGCEMINETGEKKKEKFFKNTQFIFQFFRDILDYLNINSIKKFRRKRHILLQL